MQTEIEALWAALPVREPKTLRERSELAATEAFRAAVVASDRALPALARRLDVTERVLTDWLTGVRNVPLWAAMALPRAGQIAFARCLIALLKAEGAAC